LLDLFEEMASTVATIDTHHDDMIHDVQLDYYSKRLATCSSDRTIKIFEVGENSNTQIAEIKGHEGPIWQISWAHPKFGVILASCSYDRKVCVWKEASNANWTKIYEYDKHESSVNSIAWAPATGSMTSSSASASAAAVKRIVSGGCDNLVKIWRYSDAENSWKLEETLENHTDWVRDVAWASNIGLPTTTIASCSQDGTVFIWSRSVDESNTTWSKKSFT